MDVFIVFEIRRKNLMRFFFADSEHGTSFYYDTDTSGIRLEDESPGNPYLIFGEHFNAWKETKGSSRRWSNCRFIVSRVVSGSLFTNDE
jgi:hypothetical protein